MREEELKNLIKKKWFDDYDTTRIIGDIDLSVCPKAENNILPFQKQAFLWAETKPKPSDPCESLAQLILTIGKAKTYEREMPPHFLGAVDSEKITFVEYSDVMHIFTKTDFNWNVTPSNHDTKEFKELYQLLKDTLADKVVTFKYVFDERSLKSWIKKNFKEGKTTKAKTPVNKNNFTFVYYEWVRWVKPSIAVNWNALEKTGVLDRDFFLADLMCENGKTIQENLQVVLEETKYILNRGVAVDGLISFSEVFFRDDMKAYNQFWNRYQRPPKQVYQRYILDRVDLLVPQDIREVKGSYYTPQIWVQKAQEYLEAVLGENWQDEYYIWDCAAGTGNLLRGLTNKYNVYASTLDDSDVRIMHQAIDDEHMNLLKANVFQFDFLNDDFSKLPMQLRDIVNNPERRKRLIMFINPPYAEAENKKVRSGNGNARSGLSVTLVKEKYGNEMRRAGNELYAQFYVRIYSELNGCIIGMFSTLKHLQGQNFGYFRQKYPAKLMSMFIVPANTFDNVSGQFPIGFQIYDTDRHEEFKEIFADVFIKNGKETEKLPSKLVSSYKDKKYIIDWYRESYDKIGEKLAYIRFMGTDFQSAGGTSITLKPYQNDLEQVKGTWITPNNIGTSMIYFSVRLCLPKTWLNDRDQFLYPIDGWQSDGVFQTDCLVWTLFHGQNRISAKDGTNNWIPFSEQEVNAPAPFASRFMHDYLTGKIKRNAAEASEPTIFSEAESEDTLSKAPLDYLSVEAKAVMDAGKELWKYYMSQPGADANASYYDIKAFFQGFSPKGKMNPASNDERYTELHGNLKRSMENLRQRIAPKVYEYGFLLPESSITEN